MIAYRSNPVLVRIMAAPHTVLAVPAVPVPWVPAPYEIVREERVEPPLTGILRRVAFETGVATARILGGTREKPVARARFAFVWVASMALGRTSGQIARRIDRDGSTVRHGIRRACRLRDRDPAFRTLTDRLLAEFSQGESA